MECEESTAWGDGDDGLWRVHAARKSNGEPESPVGGEGELDRQVARRSARESDRRDGGGRQRQEQMEEGQEERLKRSKGKSNLWFC